MLLLQAGLWARTVLCVTKVQTSRSPPVWAGRSLNDLHAYDPAAGGWTDLSTALSGTPPSPRDGHGLASAGGKLYVHGGGDFFGADLCSQQLFKCPLVLAITLELVGPFNCNMIILLFMPPSINP